jgi:hypothetical protein
VDGDLDLDLVISSARSFTPVGVWINDGHGEFVRSNASVQSPSALTQGDGIVSAAPGETFQASVPEFSGTCLSSAVSSSGNHDINERMKLHFNPTLPSTGAVRPAQTRGPPFFSY